MEALSVDLEQRLQALARAYATALDCCDDDLLQQARLGVLLAIHCEGETDLERCARAGKRAILDYLRQEGRCRHASLDALPEREREPLLAGADFAPALLEALDEREREE